MKYAWSFGMVVAMAAGVPAFAVAQAGECLDPTAGLLRRPGDPSLPTSPACRAPNYASSLGPIETYDVPKPKVPSAPALGSGEGADLYDLEAGTAPVISNYNDRELERLGELDAMQGRPVNMDRANNVDYLKGYTRGSERRMMPKPWR